MSNFMASLSYLEALFLDGISDMLNNCSFLNKENLCCLKRMHTKRNHYTVTYLGPLNKFNHYFHALFLPPHIKKIETSVTCDPNFGILHCQIEIPVLLLLNFMLITL